MWSEANLQSEPRIRCKRYTAGERWLLHHVAFQFTLFALVAFDRIGLDGRPLSRAESSRCTRSRSIIADALPMRIAGRTLPLSFLLALGRRSRHRIASHGTRILSVRNRLGRRTLQRGLPLNAPTERITQLPLVISLARLFVRFHSDPLSLRCSCEGQREKREEAAEKIR